jgi:hypothetical protein
MEVSEVRRRLRGAMEEAKRRGAERRTRVDEAARAYERILTDVAVPLFHTLAQALVSEGRPFKVHTPGQAVRLVPDRAPEEHVEVALDSERDIPAVVARTVRGRGRRMLSTERTVGEGKPLGEITDEDLIAVVLDELVPFIER